jgi:hypothetical protein
MNKENEVYTFTQGRIIQPQVEWNYVIFRKMDGTRNYHDKQNKW